MKQASAMNVTAELPPDDHIAFVHDVKDLIW